GRWRLQCRVLGSPKASSRCVLAVERCARSGYNSKPSDRGRHRRLPRFLRVSLLEEISVSAVHVPALLALADGTIFRGRAMGARTVSAGEVVFNTAMTGYQEIVTDL